MCARFQVLIESCDLKEASTLGNLVVFSGPMRFSRVILCRLLLADFKRDLCSFLSKPLSTIVKWPLVGKWLYKELTLTWFLLMGHEVLSSLH